MPTAEIGQKEVMFNIDIVQQPDVLIGQFGSLGRIRLNRPKALNSVTLDMVRRMSGALERFEEALEVAAVLITGEGEKGFCAGGDIRAIYESGRAGTHLADDFRREEYVLNARIDTFAKPYVAIMDGITMGGGVGISAHGSHRIVTDRTRLAMPETTIGFFPDVGGTWLLSRAPGETGTYLGLTGESIGAADALYVGLADVYVPSVNLPDLVNALETLPALAGHDRVRKIIEPFTRKAGPSALAEHRRLIDRVFASDDVEDILAALDQSDTAFAAKTKAALLAKSPTSLKLTLRLLRLGRTSASLCECLEREFAAGGKVLQGLDFYEGVRAAVIDKDRKPRWRPDHLSAVTRDAVDAYLAAVAEPVFHDRVRILGK